MTRSGNKAASARLPMCGLDTLHECHYGDLEDGLFGQSMIFSWTQQVQGRHYGENELTFPLDIICDVLYWPLRKRANCVPKKQNW